MPVRLREAFAALLPRLREAVLACYGQNLVTLAVFGSVARGTPGPDSDIDLLLICRELPQGRVRRMAGFACVEQALARDIERLEGAGIHTSLSPVFKTVAEAQAGSHLYLDMVEDVILLHDEGRFFESALNSLKERLEKLGARRVRQGSRWYWVLKPDLGPGEVIDLWPPAR